MSVTTGGLILALACCGAVVVASQGPPAGNTVTVATAGETVTLEPIECWSRTSTNAARVGELFTLVLTCAVVETASTTVVPDQSRLDPGVLQIPPFEVVRGTQATDVRAGTRRFLQYEYTLRYVGEDFGKDVALPSVTISYRVQSHTAQETAIEGRERQYILPAVMIRILSLVPAIETDIRDQPTETFGQIQARRFRATVLRVIAGSLYIVGALVVVSGLTRVLQRSRRQAPVAVRLASDSAILRRVSNELGKVRRLRGIEGWTDALAARTLVSLRVVATYAVSHPVIQSRDDGTRASEGQLVVPGRWPGQRAVLVSSSLTSVTLASEGRRIEARRTASNGMDAGTSGAEHLADLDRAMNRFSGSAYGRDGRLVDEAELDEALDVGVRVLDRLRRKHTWLSTKRRAVTSTLVRLKVRLKPDTTGGVS